MTPVATIDASTLSPYNTGSRSPLWWGFAGLVVIESAVVACFIGAYFYLRMPEPIWPPPTVPPQPLLLPSISVLILLASSFAMYRAGKVLKRDDQRGLKLGVGAALLLAAVFLVVRVIEYQDAGFRWSDHPYGSIVWTMVGLHTAHVVSAILGTGVMEIWAVRGYFNPERRLGVDVDTMYWHFVVFVWVPQYVVIYWTPRILSGSS